MEYIKKFDEFIEDQNYETMDELLQTVYTDEMLLEMARVDDPRNIPFKNKKSVWIYSDDRNKMTPHFYYYLDGSKKIYLEISISELKLFSQHQEKV